MRLTAERDDMRAQKDEIGREKDAAAAEIRRRCDEEIARLTAMNAEAQEKLAKYDGKDAIYLRQNEETEQLRAQLESVTAERDALSIESDGLRRAYEELKAAAAQVSARLDATVEELKALKEGE